jgi:hypothetical protein
MIEMPTPRRAHTNAIRFDHTDASRFAATGDSSEPDDATLEDAARREQDYLRSRLRDELGREPTEEELREWQREHTEGY